MATTDRALSDFIDAWNAGERPSVNRFLERVPAAEQDELASLINAFLEWAPNPAYSDHQRRAIAADPAVVATLDLIEERGLWPALLPSLRRRARITRDQLVERLAELLGVGGKRERVRVYYHQMESGSLDPRGVSTRVLDALAKILEVSAEELADVGDAGAPAPAVDGVFLRAEMEVGPGEVFDRLAAGPQSPGDWDEVDELFRGGR
jgi:transcriptional regulator with XRE-family HTH domain